MPRQIGVDDTRPGGVPPDDFGGCGGDVEELLQEVGLPDAGGVVDGFPVQDVPGVPRVAGGGVDDDGGDQVIQGDRDRGDQTVRGGPNWAGDPVDLLKREDAAVAERGNQ